MSACELGRWFAVLACAALLAAGCRSEATQVVPHGPASLRIAFVAGPDGYLYTVGADGRRLRRLTRGKNWGAQRVAWSPDGSRLAVVSEKVPDYDRYAGSVLVMDADGGHRHRVALLHHGQEWPRWRARDVIQVLEYEWPNKAIVSNVPLFGGGPRKVGEEPLGPLAPDGRRRALVRGDWPHEDSQIYVARADGSHAVNISRSRSVGPSPLVETSPAWSPDGTRIAFVMDRGRGDEIWVMNADGSRERRLTRGAGPEWSPDGRFLAYEADVDDDGLDELYVIAANGGHPRKLLEMNYIQDLEWRPVGRPKAATIAGPPPAGRRKSIRTFSYELTKGSGRLEDVRLLSRFASDAERPTLADISPDGSLVALFNQDGLALLDLRTNRSRVLTRPRTAAVERLALFSPNGRQVLYRHRNELLARDVRSGTSIRVTRPASGSFTWLQDGRVAFLERRTLKVVQPGRRASVVTGVPPVERFAITRDGRRLLYDRRCETFLLDRQTGRRKRLSGHLFVPEKAWSPDGSFFVLQWAEECNRKTGVVWAYHSHDLLFSAAGTLIASSAGRGATWSRDSTLLFVYPHETGSATYGMQGLIAIDPRRKRESILVPIGNAYSEAFLGPGRWVVFAKYDHPHRVSYNDTAGGLYLARLTGQ